MSQAYSTKHCSITHAASWKMIMTSRDSCFVKKTRWNWRFFAFLDTTSINCTLKSRRATRPQNTCIIFVFSLLFSLKTEQYSKILVDNLESNRTSKWPIYSSIHFWINSFLVLISYIKFPRTWNIFHMYCKTISYLMSAPFLQIKPYYNW